MEERRQITTENILDDKSFREQYISRVEVLDKVKKLLLIPEMECMTIRQVADYYEVDYKTLRRCYDRNKAEIDMDGVVQKAPRVFKETSCLFKDLQQLHGKLIVQIDDNTRLEIPNRGIQCFPKRAILRIGMLLRDSKVAQEVRTQLLNIVEHTAEEKPEIITKDINEEENLQLNIGKAYASGDKEELLSATQAYSNFQQRHIKKLESEKAELINDKKLLTAEILDLSDRKMFSAVMRKLACVLHMDFSMVYGCLYKQLNYRYGINLKARGERKKPYIQYVRSNEWDKVQKCIVALLEENNINASTFLESCKPMSKVYKRT